MNYDTFTFIHTSTNDNGEEREVRNVLRANAPSHTEVSMTFCEFLLGCGYIFDSSKTLGLVDAP